MSLINQAVGKRSLKEIIEEKKALQAKLLAAKEAIKAEEEEVIEAQKAEEAELQSGIAAPSELLNPTTPVNPAVAKKLSLKELMAQKIRAKPADSLTKREAEGTVPAPIKPNSSSTIRGTVPEITASAIPVAPIPTRIRDELLKQTEEEKEEIKENLADFPLEDPSEEAYSGAFSLDIQLNEKQLLAKDMAFSGKSFALVGAAGTGKTATQREIARSLLESKCLSTHDFRIQGTGEVITAPSIAFIAYTRVASGNLRRAIHKLPELEEALRHNITTVHNLLEYTPETYWDYEQNKECFRFIPRRTAANPLDITHLVIEESSMLGLDPLWYQLFAALRPGVQIIFIGDINQLTPVFGDSILNYALVQLPVVELTKVYRQAEGSSILENAHRILKGESIVEAPDFKVVRVGTVNHTQARLSITLGMTFPKWYEAGAYDPLQDIILSPWNVRDLGTDNMNKWIAQFLGTQRSATVHQIIAGMTTLYLAEGDKVMCNKQVGVITRIAKNAKYMGKAVLPASVNLNRFGTYTGGLDESLEDLDAIDYSGLDLDAMLETENGDRTKEASHFVDILLDDGMEVTLSAIGDFASQSFTLAYALTVHKAQGCEWRKVYFIMHRDHSVSLCRELLYTAVTRAREQMVIIAKDDVIEKAIKTQRIKGNTTAEKIEYFNSGIKLNNAVYCVK